MNSSTDRTHPVVVCIDGSDESLVAARWAAHYSARIHAPLRLVHTVPAGDWYGSAVYVDGGELEVELRRRGNESLERASRAVLAVEPETTAETVTADGALADFVAGTRAELVVLGTRKSSYARDVMLGSNTIQVVNRAQSPVLVWRHDTSEIENQRPIVVGVDGSDASDRAFAVALDMAHTLRVPLVAANFWGIAAEAGIGFGAGYVDWDKVRSEEKHWLRSRVSVLHQKFPKVPLSTVSTDTSPSQGLKQLSETALIVAVGCRGRGRLGGAVLGSVSQNLIHHADSSVLIVR
ncbi:hypothetical protein CH300_10260 [Rhodococcus sp. 15-1154-1]|nr:universal stress protein [Rhodococcus sp. 15-1154-1]OZF06427.1 hypothetical protein CH300_10260 [Rhodococcus sp. 15-1154-1]